MSNDRELIQSLYDAFARGDAGVVLAAFDPGIVWLEAENGPYADGNPYFGPHRVAQGVFARIAGEWDDFFFYPDTLLQDGDTVIAAGRYRGTYRGTGRALNAQFVHVWTVRNGRIVRFQQYADTARFHRVMEGATEAASPASTHVPAAHQEAVPVA